MWAAVPEKLDHLDLARRGFGGRGLVQHQVIAAFLVALRLGSHRKHPQTQAQASTNRAYGG